MSTTTQVNSAALTYPQELTITFKLLAHNQGDYDYITGTDESSIVSDAKGMFAEVDIHVLEVNGVTL
jgi:hypothetical protein